MARKMVLAGVERVLAGDGGWGAVNAAAAMAALISCPLGEEGKACLSLSGVRENQQQSKAKGRRRSSDSREIFCLLPGDERQHRLFHACPSLPCCARLQFSSRPVRR